MDAEAFERLVAAGRADPAVARLAARIGRGVTFERDGRAHVVVAGPAADVVVQAPAQVWDAMLAPLPAPGHQSFGAAQRAEPRLRVVAEPLAWAQALPMLERLIEAMRAAAHPVRDDDAELDLDRLDCRHRRIRWSDGRDTWVYEEAAGDPSQPVMLCLHTAGADARQWHGVMTDAALGRRWRMVAFDMPSHGRSPPPPGWRGEPWQLTAARYLDVITAWMDASGLQRVAVTGCSMGAAIGLAFLARRAPRAHGAILLETPWRSPGRRNDFLDHPAVHGGRFGAAWVQALLSPHSPAAHRRRATWIYAQSAPGVYEGDLAFYSDEFDAAHYTGDIDTRRTPLWLMTGDYDYSATPADTRKVAAAVPGAQFMQLDGFGHFPMTEDPQRLLAHFRPAADALRATIAP